MTIGIPRALAYHRYGTLWETFFDELGVSYVVSGETDRRILETGAKYTESESCLPHKLYMGHVHSLLGRCDRVFVPRFVRFSRREEFCVRFWGLPDTVRGTFAETDVFGYTLCSGGRWSQEGAFLRMGRNLGGSVLASVRAYRIAARRQRELDFKRFSRGRASLRANKPKILLAANPYIAYDPILGGRIGQLVRAFGAVPVFADAWDPMLSKEAAGEISTDLYWGFQRETMGAVHLARGQVDGVILLTAFPCGSDCLANELILRRVRDLPVIQILLDEHQSHEGLQTRVESFLDMIAGERVSG